VGYTNAGKTSLFNSLTKGGLYAADKLFATLDTTTRKADFKSKNQSTVLFSDTVGFISNLPTKLIESFKATLDDLSSADLLLHVIDAADPETDFKVQQVRRILDDLGVDKIPQIRVLNKSDLIPNNLIKPSSNEHPEIKVSAETGDGLDHLKTQISEMLFGEILTGWICFSPTQSAIRSKLFDSGCIVKEEIDKNGSYQSFVEISKSMLQQFDNLEGANSLKPLST
jgi:GTP-binding protein HflX